MNVCCFLHVAKTGGDSFRRLAYYNTPDDQFIDFLEPRRATEDGIPVTAGSSLPSVDALVGELSAAPASQLFVCSNLPYGLHARVDRRFQYLTFLREPVARARSYWKFVYRNRDVSPLWREWEALRWDISSIVERPCGLALVNDQTRLLDGRPLVEIDVEHARAVIKDASKRFFFVGDFQRYAAQVGALCRHFGWDYTQVPRVNVATAESASSIPPHFDDVIRAGNAPDALLYAWAASLPTGFLDDSHDES